MSKSIENFYYKSFFWAKPMTIAEKQDLKYSGEWQFAVSLMYSELRLQEGGL